MAASPPATPQEYLDMLGYYVPPESSRKTRNA